MFRFKYETLEEIRKSTESTPRQMLATTSLAVIAKLTDDAKLLITASAAVTGIPLMRVITVVKTPVHVPKKHPAEISDPKTAWKEVIGGDILPQRPVIPPTTATTERIQFRSSSKL